MRPLWFLAGLVSLGLGWIGLVMPMMPGFIFLLGAMYCFARSNPEWEQRMLDHPTYGAALRDWRDHRRIARKAKYQALGLMAFAAVLTAIFAPWPILLLPIGIMTLVAGWIWMRPE